jgi:transcription-repair coupling factor (superfamily II helicase)
LLHFALLRLIGHADKPQAASPVPAAAGRARNLARRPPLPLRPPMPSSPTKSRTPKSPRKTRAATSRAPAKPPATRPPVRQPLSSAAPLGLLALHLLHRARRETGGVLFIASDEARAERLGAILHALDPGCGVMVLPRFDTLPFEQLPPSREIAGRRANVLRRLAERVAPPLLVATVEALLPRVPPPQHWAAASLRVAVGDAFDPDGFAQRLTETGYDLDEAPDYPGGALLHGQTLELYPAGALGPVRIAHADGIVRAIALLDLRDHSEIAPLAELVIDPMDECPDDDGNPNQGVSLFSLLDGVRLIADAGTPARAATRLAALDEAGVSPRRRAASFLTAGDWREATADMAILPAEAPCATVPVFAHASSARNALRRFVAGPSPGGARLVFTAASEADLKRMERLAGVTAIGCPDWRRAARPPAGRITALLVDLDRGFVAGTLRPLVVITAADVLGSRAHHIQPMARAAAADLGLAAPLPGSAVLHLQRGLAILEGLEEVASPGLAAHAMLRLRFAGDEIALVPVAELALLWPHAGDPGGLRLDSADGASWAARRGEAEQALASTAEALSRAVAARRATPAPRLVPPAADYERFVARFPYGATPHQIAAVEDVLADLAAGHPMDRIVCGDVGFGKTEVALRAAAAVVLAGKQVVVVVPTTVLARQHATTFRRRFAALGIDVGELSRLTPPAEARQVREALADGTLRLVIGTQALAGKDVQFHDLGLVAIDEEQHFGAADKARLASLQAGTHTLTMSATPIPRTLAGALAGLRDLSTIATPPVQRVPVVTNLAALDDVVLASALRREQRRRGQSFVVAPKISDLAPLAERLRRAAPELTVLTVHGRLPGDELDARMQRFIDGGADVLLATNIIENGLDIPRANTIAICRSEEFGLAQLHQLRGRVGRGGTRAFAWLLTENPGEAAEQRLAALRELGRPGAGLAISARDLDLRGAGDLLSEQQAGHVQVFGPALTHHLLAEALAGRPLHLDDAYVPELRLDVAALLPEVYVPDETTRLALYWELARTDDADALADLAEDVAARFGHPPPEVTNLIALAQLRLACRALGIARLDAGPAGLAVTPRPDAPALEPAAPLARAGGRIVWKREVAPADIIAVAMSFIARLDDACARS